MRCTIASRTGVLLACLLLALLGGGCTRRERTVSAASWGAAETGTASYYSDSLQGHRTASGERYDRTALTAAHRTLPFGTSVRVTNLSNARSVVVRVNDRGPFAGGRLIDVSRAAAERLGMVAAGVVRVRVEAVR